MKELNLLTEEFEAEIKELGKLPPGTEEHKATAAVVAQLADRIIRLRELEDERDEKMRVREMDAHFKQKELDQEKKSDRIKNIIAVGTTLLSTGVLIWGTVGTWKFDANHVTTSTQGRSWINGLYPKWLKQ